MKYIVKKEMNLILMKNGELVKVNLNEGDLLEFEKTVSGYYLAERNGVHFTISEEELKEHFNIFVSDTVNMETLWLQFKVDKRNGEVVAYDSSLLNEFIKTEKQNKEFYELCMDFKEKLQLLKDKGTYKEQNPKYLLCTRSDNGCFIKGNKYEIKGTTSKGDYIIKDEYFEAEFTVKLNGYLWTFEVVSEDEEEIKVPKLLCTYSFSDYSEFERGKAYEIIEKVDDNRYLVIGGRGTESLIALDGGLWKFKLI